MQQACYSLLAQVFCVNVLTLLKISISLSYLRILRGSYTKHPRWVYYATSVLVFALNTVCHYLVIRSIKVVGSKDPCNVLEASVSELPSWTPPPLCTYIHYIHYIPAIPASHCGPALAGNRFRSVPFLKAHNTSRTYFSPNGRKQARVCCSTRARQIDEMGGSVPVILFPKNFHSTRGTAC